MPSEHTNTGNCWAQSMRRRRARFHRELAQRVSQSGHPLRAEITVTVHGRRALGRPAPRTHWFGLDLLLGQLSEEDLLRKLNDAIESTYLADLHCAQRASEEARLRGRMEAERADFEAELQARREAMRDGDD